MPPVRRLANWFGGLTYSWALGQHIPDNQSGYRLLSRHLLEALAASEEQGFEFEVDMITICIQQGFTLTWVPIKTIYTDESSHINPIQHVKNFTRLVWHTKKTMADK